MLIPIISQYLRSQKRLVVPQMGAFIVKDPDKSVVFSEFLKRDDGVLRGLLRESGIGDLEAAGEIDRFVFEVRHALQQGNEFPLEGLGVLKPGPNGTIAFVHDPHLVASVHGAEAAERQARAEAKAKVAEAADDAGVSAPHAAAGKQQGSKQLSEKIKTLYDGPGLFDEEEPQRPSFRPRRRSSRSDEYYGKLPRRPAIEQTIVVKRRSDHFIWIALVATAIALGAIAFGHWCDTRDQETVPLRHISEEQATFGSEAY